MRVTAWVGFAVGLVVLLVTGSSVVKTLLIPRNVDAGLTTLVSRAVYAGYRTVTVRTGDLARREQIHATSAPVFLFALLTCWIALLYVGFALLLWPFLGGNLAAALRASGSSLFTLGFASPTGAAPEAIVFVAAASGLGAIALLIAYLPTLYGAFNRRETLVTMLDALAGTPPWGPELLARQALIGNVGYLPRLYERWTEWAAEISESHTTYRPLIYFRSPDPRRSWLLALLAVLDAAALHITLCPDSAPAEARPLLRVGYVAVRSLARTLRLPVDEDPHPEDPVILTRGEFDAAVRHLRAAGWVMERTSDQAWPQFRGWRVNYEQAGRALASYLDLPPALWSGPRVRHNEPPPAPKRPPHRAPAALDPYAAVASARAGDPDGPAGQSAPGPAPATSTTQASTNASSRQESYRPLRPP